MANQLFYFGTTERMAWLPCPNSGMNMNNAKWRASGTFLNGGSYARESSTSHREYNMTWPVMSHEDAYSLIDYFNGTYGESPYYFLDPMAMGRNILPTWLASPRLQALDAPSMVAGVVPTLASLAASTNGYPPRSAEYSLGASQSGLTFRFPVPPGYTFRFGWYGTASGTARVRLTGATVVDVSPIANLGGNVRFNSVVAPDSTGFVNVQLIGGASGGLANLRGMTAIVLPTAETNPTGGFVSGRGNSGVKLSAEPQITAYSANIPNANVGVSASFTETGAWL